METGTPDVKRLRETPRTMPTMSNQETNRTGKYGLAMMEQLTFTPPVSSNCRRFMLKARCHS